MGYQQTPEPAPNRIRELMEKCGESGFYSLEKSEAEELFVFFASMSSEVELPDIGGEDEPPFAFFSYSEEMLRKCGFTDGAICLITHFHEVANRCMSEPNRTPMNGYESKKADGALLQSLIHEKYLGVNNERVLLMLFDSEGVINHAGFIADGTGKSAVIDVSSICRISAEHGAHFVVMAHNHPSGSMKPSQADCTATANLYRSLKMLGISLVDHYIVTRDGCRSIRLTYDFYNENSDYLKWVIDGLSKS